MLIVVAGLVSEFQPKQPDGSLHHACSWVESWRCCSACQLLRRGHAAMPESVIDSSRLARARSDSIVPRPGVFAVRSAGMRTPDDRPTTQHSTGHGSCASRRCRSRLQTALPVMIGLLRTPIIAGRSSGRRSRSQRAARLSRGANRVNSFDPVSPGHLPFYAVQDASRLL